jgi:hypothetical protein
LILPSPASFPGCPRTDRDIKKTVIRNILSIKKIAFNDTLFQSDLIIAYFNAALKAY